MKDVYVIYDARTDGRERSRWVRIGVAFDNKDGSLNVLLDALPLSGRLHIREREGDPTGNGAKRPKVGAEGRPPAGPSS